MVKELYGIKDCKIGEVLHLFEAVNEEIARRQMGNAVNDDTKTELVLNTSDFELYRLGKFNHKTGEIESKVEFICNLIEFKKVVTRSTKKVVK